MFHDIDMEGAIDEDSRGDFSRDDIWYLKSKFWRIIRNIRLAKGLIFQTSHGVMTDQ